MKSGDNKKFDLIIFGATGFTESLYVSTSKKNIQKVIIIGELLVAINKN